MKGGSVVQLTHWLTHVQTTPLLCIHRPHTPLTFWKMSRLQSNAPQRFCLQEVKDGTQPRCRPHVRSSLKPTLGLKKRPFTRSARRTKACCWCKTYPVCIKTTLYRSEIFNHTSASVVTWRLLWPTDSYGHIEPDMVPLWHLGIVASSFVMLNESTEDTLYNMAQVANITQLVGPNL